MSRPPKTEATKMSHQIIFRLKREDYDRLQTQAARVGLSVNQLARKLTRERTHKLVITTYQRMDPIFITRLERLGNNLNQITKNSHIFKRISPNLEKLCHKIEQLIDEAINDELDP